MRTKSDYVAITGHQRGEVETHINFSGDDELLEVYTTDNRIARKLYNMSNEANSLWKIKHIEYAAQDHHIIAYIFTAPISCVSFRKSKRVVSDETRQAMAQRMRNYHLQKSDTD